MKTLALLEGPKRLQLLDVIDVLRPDTSVIVLALS